YWGDAWNQDLDGDGLINLLDPDSDDDWDLDGSEIPDGFDPGDANSTEPSMTNIVFETGTADIDSLLAHIDFQRTYTSPVVTVGPLGHGDGDPATVRIHNLGPDGCDIRIQEWAYQDNAHGREDLGYMVMEKGEYVLDDGTMIQAGTFGTSPAGGARDIQFGSVFNQPPVILTAVVTQNDPSPCVVRLSGISNLGFSCTLQEEESADQLHGSETVGFVAWEPSSGVVNRKRFEVVNTPMTVTSIGYDLLFGQKYSVPPVLLGGMQTFNGENPANVRCRLLTNTMAGIHIDEEQSLDSEEVHYGETIGYAVFED
ncbi:hypothetical protein, partial [Desulfoplanes sp.]